MAILAAKLQSEILLPGKGPRKAGFILNLWFGRAHHREFIESIAGLVGFK